ncbi:MAG TPA: flagellar export chaperone FliS [Acidobacteriaceae bacterium]|nr:flagellar export chaperone FliS [Acidobacteriaceae bacterium]
METTYQQQALRSANGVELIVALYDGAIRFLYRAIQAVEERDEIDRRAAVKRALDVLMYLQARLRTDIAGGPAAALADFYTAMFTMTLEASHAESREGFEEVIACLRNVRDAWQIVAQDPEAQEIAPREMRSATLPVVAPPATRPAGSASPNWMA